MTALTIIVIVVFVAIAAVILLILTGNWLSDRTYKPKVTEVIQHLEDCRAGRMGRGQFDEFSCVRIAYDRRLDAIRKKFCDIAIDPQNIEGNNSENDWLVLNNTGKRKIDELINELRQLQDKKA